MDCNQIKYNLLGIAVERLQHDGHIHADKINIFYDNVYSKYFHKMLSETMGQFGIEADEAIIELRSELNDGKIKSELKNAQ